MQHNDMSLSRNRESLIATNKVLRNTYLLLGLTLVFSGVMAGISMAINAAPLNIFIMLAGFYGLMFLTTSLRNSVWGLAAIFAFTGFLGFTLGPVLNYYIHAFSNGGQIVMTSLGATGVIFFALSGYVMTTQKDFSYLGGFLFVGVMVVLLAMLASVFFPMPALHLAISAAFVLISSGMILFQTSLIINGGERNYIMATISLYVSLYNLFLSLLQIFGALAGNRD